MTTKTKKVAEETTTETGSSEPQALTGTIEALKARILELEQQLAAKNTELETAGERAIKAARIQTSITPFWEACRNITDFYNDGVPGRIGVGSLGGVQFTLEHARTVVAALKP
jgi:hypothetical protein